MRSLRTFDHLIFFGAKQERRLMDAIRGQLVPAGPEEHVRQDVVRSLLEEYGYHRTALFTEEPVITGGGRRRRADVLVALPARPPAPRLLAGASRDPRSDRYGDRLEAARELVHAPFLRFVELPEVLRVEIDGSELLVTPIGFRVDCLNVVLTARPVSPRPDLPEVLALHVLGYGRTRAEEGVAGALGLTNVLGSEPASYQIESIAGMLSQPGCLVARGVSANGTDGFMLAWPGDQQVGVLVEVRLPAGSEIELARQMLEWLPSIETARGVFAYREELDRLEPGDLVEIERSEEGLCGEVIATDEKTVTVRVDGARVVALREFEAGEWLLMGRSRPLQGPPVEEPGPSQRPDRTLIVVECKRPGLAFSQEVLDQGTDYARTLQAQYLVLTTGAGSGGWTKTYALDPLGAREVNDIPTYAEATSEARFQVEARPPEPRHRPLPAGGTPGAAVVQLHARARGCIGQDTSTDLWLPLLQIDDLLRAERPWFERRTPVHGVTFLRDLGLRHHEPGNASGGTFAGSYRDFLIERADGSQTIFGLAIFETYKSVDHPTYGNRPSRSMLAACLADAGVYHPVLEASLEDVLQVNRDGIHLWHSGKATVGKGALRISRVLDFVREHQPTWGVRDRVPLGRVRVGSPEQHGDVRDMLGRIARYVELRAKLKDAVRKERART
jgi:hypothetical protein